MKESGIGRENGLEAFEACTFARSWLGCHAHADGDYAIDTQSKSTIVNIASAQETRSVQDWFAEEDDSEKRYG